MIVYRIADKKYIHDLSGIGAKLSGGRWNHKGTSLVYTSESISLAMVEFLVHLPISLSPPNLMLASIHIPDNIHPIEISISDLPTTWQAYPPPARLADIGTQWAKNNKSLLMRIPSAVIAREWNILINPAHNRIRDTSVLTEKFRLDERLLRK